MLLPESVAHHSWSPPSFWRRTFIASFSVRPVAATSAASRRRQFSEGEWVAEGLTISFDSFGKWWIFLRFPALPTEWRRIRFESANWFAQLLYLLSRLSSDPCRKRSQNRKLAKFGWKLKMSFELWVMSTQNS
jgi:hypothetical protein